MKKKFHSSKNPVVICDVDISKIISNAHLQMTKIKNDAKLFIRYKDNKKIRPLCIKLPKKNEYVNSVEETKYKSFEIRNNELLKKYNKILSKVSNTIEKAFDTQPVFEEKYLNTKLKYCNGKSSTHFFDKKSTPKNVNCV